MTKVKTVWKAQEGRPVLEFGAGRLAVSYGAVRHAKTRGIRHGVRISYNGRALAREVGDNVPPEDPTLPVVDLIFPTKAQAREVVRAL